MGTRYVPTRDADRRAIELYLTLREVEEMPEIRLHVEHDPKTPIIIQDRNDTRFWEHYTVDGFLTLDVKQAKANGGTFQALRLSRKRPAKPRLPQTEIDRAVHKYMNGDDDE